MGTAVKLGARGRPKHRLKRQYDNKLSPDKRMMPYVTAPNIGFVTPIATGILALEKARKWVFRQNGGENYFRFRFSLHIRFSVVDLVDNATNLEIASLTLFREI